MEYNLKYSQYSERSILIEWPSIIDENILESVLNFKNYIKDHYIKQKVEITNTYNSILIIYNFTIDNINDRFLELKAIFKSQDTQLNVIFYTWEIPVCYDEEFGMGLDDFSKEKKLSKLEIIKLHSEQIYKVYFIGFLPGFLYLGGLDSRLHLERKQTPNLNVKKGSVAIGGQQSGIYPQNSPGGWHVIGNTPIDIFDASKLPPCQIKAGDKVKFQPIDKYKYLDIKKQLEETSFQLKPIKTNA